MKKMRNRKNTLNNRLKEKRFLPYWIFGTILLLSSLVLFFQYENRKNAVAARIYQDGILIKEVSLSDVKDSYQFRVDYSEDAYNKIKVEKGAIGIVETNCPDKICQKRGMVSKTGYPITCLPHKLVIELESSANEAFDAVAE